MKQTSFSDMGGVPDETTICKFATFWKGIDQDVVSANEALAFRAWHDGERRHVRRRDDHPRAVVDEEPGWETGFDSSNYMRCFRPSLCGPSSIPDNRFKRLPLPPRASSRYTSPDPAAISLCRAARLPRPAGRAHIRRT